MYISHPIVPTTTNYYHHLHSFHQLHIYPHIPSTLTLSKGEAMDKSQKYQLTMLSILAILFLITPLLSTSMRPPYLYFLLNLLIVSLGAEAGLLSFLKPVDDKKPAPIVAPKPIVMNSGFIETSPYKVTGSDTNNIETTTITASSAITYKLKFSPPKVSDVINKDVTENTEKKVRKVTKSASEKATASATIVSTVSKCPSMPSLFFIGSGEAEAEETEEVEAEECLTKQELFTKAETFIRNFRKQSKIQREDSWKKIHGFYQKAF